MPLSFTQIIEDVISEENVSGGTGSVFGTGVTATSSPFSGDTYAPGDARRPKILGGMYRRQLPKDFITSTGLRKKNKKKKKH